uniref:Uncharacterized protein n=1 Tax=Acrobeloides nanus TaxID=290746 RepID=A0A914E327_9BILA
MLTQGVIMGYVLMKRWRAVSELMPYKSSEAIKTLQDSVDKYRSRTVRKSNKEDIRTIQKSARKISQKYKVKSMCLYSSLPCFPATLSKHSVSYRTPWNF